MDYLLAKSKNWKSGKTWSRKCQNGTSHPSQKYWAIFFVRTLKKYSVGVVSALNRQLSAETVIGKLWSLSAETYLYLSAETFLILTIKCWNLRVVISAETYTYKKF